MKKTLVRLMVMLLLSFICVIAGSATAYAQSVNPPPPAFSVCLGDVGAPVRVQGISELIGEDLVICVKATKDSNQNIVSAEAKLDARVYSCSATNPLPTIIRIEINRAASAANANTVTYLSIPIEPINAKVKNRTIRITNVRAPVATDIVKEIISNPTGLSVTMFTTPGPPEGTVTAPLVPVPSDEVASFAERLKKIHNEVPAEGNIVYKCRLDYELSREEWYRNRLFGGFDFIREDAKPDNFNTYGLNIDYTRFLNQHVGLTGDFNLNFKQQNGVDLTKTSVLGGVTIVPFNGAGITDKVTISANALFGVSHLTSSVGSVSASDNAFTMKLGGAVDVNVNQHFFIRPIQIDYAPTFFGTTTQNNVQFTFGAGYRFGHTGSTPANVPKGP